MKKTLSTLLTFVLVLGPLQSQDMVFLEEQEVDLPDSKSSAWVFPIVKNLEEGLDDLQDYVKERSDIRMKKGGDNVLIAEKESMPILSTMRGDLVGYAYITEQYYAMALVFQLGYDISLNSESWPDEMENLRNYAKAFMTYHFEQAYARRIKDAEKELKDVEKDLSQAENKIDNHNKKIQNLGKRIGKEEDTSKISEYEAEINSNEADMRILLDQLPGLRAKIKDIKDRIEEFKEESNAYHSAIGTL